MLEELADAYPSVKDQALELKEDILDLMPGEEMPDEEPDLSLNLDDEEEELDLEL